MTKLAKIPTVHIKASARQVWESLTDPGLTIQLAGGRVLPSCRPAAASYLPCCSLSAGAQTPIDLIHPRSESRYKMFCATVLYPSQEGSNFDFEYYSKTLAPLYAEFLGANCAGYEVRKGLMTPGAPRAAFALIASYWVRSDKEYQNSLADPRFPEIMTKFAAFTNVEPIRQFDEVLSGDSLVASMAEA